MKKRPRLVLLTMSFPPEPGGVQNYLYEIFRRLAGRFDITVLHAGAQPESAPERNFTTRYPSNRPLEMFGELRRLQPQSVVVGHAHPRLLLPAAMYGPYALSAYGNDFLAGQVRWHRWVFNALIRKADPLITISKASSGELEKLGLRPEKIIYPGTDPEFFTPPATHSEKPILLSVGRLVPRKGIDTAITAMTNLVKQYPDLEYRIAGSGPDLERLQGLARAQGVEKNVRFLGRVPQPDLPGLYRQASIFLLPVREEKDAHSIEGFGIVFLEASASGLPVIAGRSGGAVEAVREGETGLLIQPGDPGAVETAVRQLIEHPEVQARMGANGRAWVENTMNWDRAAAEMAEALLS